MPQQYGQQLKAETTDQSDPARGSALKKLRQIDAEINQQFSEFRKERANRQCYPLLMFAASMSDVVVDDVFDDLRQTHNDCGGRLDVMLLSGGGDIGAAYNLAMLLRRFATEELTFIIPRWAKSAATLLACSGNAILMSPVAELGPLDPQITEVNPLQERVERFSPLHIEATLSLIREEFTCGSEKLAKGLVERLQFPLTLGSFKKSLDIAKEYLTSLLSTRMLVGDNIASRAREIAVKLTEGYPDHSYCIDIDEAKRIGLTAEALEGKLLDVSWGIHKLAREKHRIQAELKRQKMEKRLKQLRPELREILPNSPTPAPPQEGNLIRQKR